MLIEHEKDRNKLIHQVIKLAKQKLSSKKAGLIAKFAKRYYSNVALEDLKERSLKDLYAILVSHWDFIYKRAPGESKVRVFNPDLKHGGWQSSRTIIQISHDNMPFLVNSVRMYVNRKGLLVHFLIQTGGMVLLRDKNDKITDILSRQAMPDDKVTEAPICLAIDRITDLVEIEKFQRSIEHILNDVTVIVRDWAKMHEHLQQALAKIDQGVPSASTKEEVAESKDFLRWVSQKNFIFFGCRDYRLIKKQGKKILSSIPGTSFGVLRKQARYTLSRDFSEMPQEARKLMLSPQILIFAKTDALSTVHRDAYTDYIGVKQFDEKGNLIGERRFIGLYTSGAYHSNPLQIPFLRHKIRQLLQHSRFNPMGYAGKALRSILETLPRDDLFQAPSEELLALSIGILHLQDRQRIKVFIRKDIYERYYSCLLFVPRDHFNTALRWRMQNILMQRLDGKSVSFTTVFLGSALARIHFMVRINPKKVTKINETEIEEELIKAGRSWNDELQDDLVSDYGEAKGLKEFYRYKEAFPASYQEQFSAHTAVSDIERIEALFRKSTLSLHFYRPHGRAESTLHLKIFRCHHTILLSDVLPMLENMGLRIIEECPHHIVLKDKTSVWLNDFEMVYEEKHKINVDEVRDVFQEAFAALWHGYAENDPFNKLILTAHLNWREVVMLRAYTKYLKQTGFTFSRKYIAETLNENPTIASYIVKLFKTRFNPDFDTTDVSASVAIETKITKALDDVASLDQDRILRRYLEIVKATIRTNYFQESKGNKKQYLSFKFDSVKISDLPLPYPTYEIFVYSPRFEGIHLRGAKVARGGLRWSDRQEDFRTEVLGLMKAQRVKNAVIVPLGAKGGFVAKCLPKDGDRDQIMKEGVACYKNFIRGLLDITDNLQNREIIHPEKVVCYDDGDPYLVVAADKGTTTFSDIANEISKEYSFWLGDAFASGGSAGYDHKEIGITARGTWESVKRHFREMGVDTQTKNFTVVGIGDMAGDVFGNGMLLSEHIQLVAAFNHMHIFIDPKPKPKGSFEERQRLFDLPRSTWADYDESKISKGGGVFKRSDKYIEVTPEIKKLFNLSKDRIIPNDLIRVILKSKVDLLFNGGIGTFVKATTETNLEVGDRTNDIIRINGDELNCKVIAEGGNLGLTQLARIEYALNDGRIYTDFIDNSAGVDCSDHEVNIKILLNNIIAKGKITRRQRNKVLADMTNQVAKLVLENNYSQTQAISLELFLAVRNLDLYARFLKSLEQQGKINRALEYLPNSKMIAERKSLGKGFVQPEIAVLLAYSKITLKEELLASDIPEDPYLGKMMLYEFPGYLRSKYSTEMSSHGLRREIIATQISNRLINEMGPTFIHRLKEESGASVADVIRAFAISRKVFSKDKLWNKIENLGMQVGTSVQSLMLIRINGLVLRGTRWFLRIRADLDIESTIRQFIRPVEILNKSLVNFIAETDKVALDKEINELVDQHVPLEIAKNVAGCSVLLSALDIVQASLQSGLSIRSVARAYFSLGALLDLNWFRKQIVAYQADTHWDALARVAFRDDLDRLQRRLTIAALKSSSKRKSIQDRVERWIEKKADDLTQWRSIIADIQSASSVEPVMFSVGLRELFDLA
jgi:glutamate dehydrogenase